jgi:hypothetical protein
MAIHPHSLTPLEIVHIVAHPPNAKGRMRQVSTKA